MKLIFGNILLMLGFEKLFMTVQGDDIVKSCRNCWVQHSFGIRLAEDDRGKLHCPICHQTYVVEKGFLKTI